MTDKSEIENLPFKLSVIVVSPYSRAALSECLDSIFANKNHDSVEILVADCGIGGEKAAADLTETYPAVRFFQFPEKAGIPVLAAKGISLSSGEIIALTDSSCVVDSNWISSILSAHQASPASPAIGGAVEVRDQMKILDWAAYFCEYGQFARPLRRGPVDELPGNNISFKRSSGLDAGSGGGGGKYFENEFWKTYWCQELQSKGVRLMSEPSILVYYAKRFKFVPFLVRRFRHGRCFAGMRIRKITFSARLIYIAGSFLLPLVFLYRTTVSVLGKKRFLKKLLLSFPCIVLAILFWCAGETCGYLAGKGKSCDYIY